LIGRQIVDDGFGFLSELRGAHINGLYRGSELADRFCMRVLSIRQPYAELILRS
jgi:hypothetical protein